MQKKYKILYLVSTLQSTAPTKQLFNIIKYLDRDIFDPVVVTLSKEPEESYRDKFISLDIPLYSLETSRVLGVFLNSFRLKNLLQKIKPHLIHSNGIRADSLSASLSGYKRMSTLRSNSYNDYIFEYGKKIGTFLANKELDAILSLEYPLSVSKSISDMLKEKRGVDVWYIHDGIETSLFDCVKEDKRSLRESLNLPLDKKIFISVGNLNRGKDPLTIIEAFKRVNNDSFYLLFLGEGELLKECKERAKESKNISFRGFVDNVPLYLKASDCFISASLSEGMPNAPLEALASGLVVILSDINPHREILDFDKRVGELFKTKSVKDLQSKMISLNEKEYQKRSKAAKELIKENFTAEKNSKKYQEAYLKLIKGQK